MSCSHGRVLAHGALYEDAGDTNDEPIHEVGDEEDKKTKSSNYQKDKMTKKQDDKHADEVGDEEGCPAVVEGHVREPPNIPQPHSVAHHGEDEVKPK